MDFFLKKHFLFQSFVVKYYIHLNEGGELFMLSAKGLLDALSQENVSTENYKNSNNDKDFGKVLDSYEPVGSTNGYVLRCPDGQERLFSLDNN